MSLKKIKKITEEILNEATLDQVVNGLNREEVIKQAIYDNSFSQGDEFYYRLNYEMEDSDAEGIIKELGEEVPESTSYIDYFRDTLDFEDYSETQAYKQFVHNEVGWKLDQAISDLQYIKSTDNKITLFRAMSVEHRNMKGKEIPVYKGILSWLDHLSSQGKHLGIYWAESYDKAQEFGHSNVGNNFYIIEVDVENKYINWYDTITLRMDFSLGEEGEIRLFKNTPLKIKNIYEKGNWSSELGEPIDGLGYLKDKTFYA